MIKYLGLVLLLTLFECNQNSDPANSEFAKEKTVAPTMAQKATETLAQKLIKEGQVEFETDDLNTIRKVIFKAVYTHQGYVSFDQEYKSLGRKSNTIVIRVPADNFNTLLSDATQNVMHFNRREINVKDVTEEFIDIQARLSTKKELEQRYIALLQKANTVIEILEIEKQIGQLRTEVDSIEARLKYLEDSVAFSTLTMVFYENIPIKTQFGRKFKNSFSKGWDNLIWFLVALTTIWPFLLIGLGLFFGIRTYRRRKK